MITQKDLDADKAIMDRIDELRRLKTLTDTEQKEWDDLHHQYYVTNEHIRTYWKTF
jgi:hypothetical protein